MNDQVTIDQLKADLLSLEDARDKREREKRPWRSLHEHVEEIEAHKNDVWVAIKIGPDEIVRLRAGGMAVLVGGPGSGKSTLAANFLYQHATEEDGVSIMHSAELPGMEFTARAIGMKCDQSWVGVLTGQVAYEEMRRVTDLERFAVLERDWATIANLRLCALAMQARFPGKPVLAAVDYVQILENEQAAGGGGKEERLRIADIVKALDKLARELGIVIIALSQMSTANAKSARAGDAIGNDAGELAAETSAFNRYATVALSIGKKSDPFEDGSRTVELSIGKSRMGGGDLVIPMREWGRSGKWRVDGEARTATQVRDGRDTEKQAVMDQQLENEMFGAAQRSKGPLSRDELMNLVKGRKNNKRQMVAKLLSNGELVEVAQRAARSRLWAIWTRDRAVSAGMQLAQTVEVGHP